MLIQSITAVSVIIFYHKTTKFVKRASYADWGRSRLHDCETEMRLISQFYSQLPFNIDTHFLERIISRLTAFYLAT